MTLAPGTRVTRRGRTGTAQTYQGLPHRTLVMWDDDPRRWVQFVDDDLLEPVAAEQEALPL